MGGVSKSLNRLAETPPFLNALLTSDIKISPVGISEQKDRAFHKAYNDTS